VLSIVRLGQDLEPLGNVAAARRPRSARRKSTDRTDRTAPRRSAGRARRVDEGIELGDVGGGRGRGSPASTRSARISPDLEVLDAVGRRGWVRWLAVGRVLTLTVCNMRRPGWRLARRGALVALGSERQLHREHAALTR
jgi:hypothetical protein